MKKFNSSTLLLKVLFTLGALASTALCISAHTAEQPVGYTVVDDKATTPILSPALSERKVLKLRLDNGLEAYIISDPKADKSAATLAVNVGSWSEPAEWPGLAHFCEHMLFLGTTKYPNESEYSRFVTEHGGVTNAFTADNETAFAFSVNHDALEETLDRFSWFFKEPLFNPSGVSRELQAVNQEYSKNIEHDLVREYFVHKELSNSQHPYHRFNFGNAATLGNVSQEALKKWYESHYSSNLMHLVVYSSLPIERLRDIVVADFGGIKNTNKTPFDTELPVTAKELTGYIVYIEPIQDVRALSLTWELPSKFANQLQNQSDDIISFILGHEGSESLLAQLKKEGLAEGLGCGGRKVGPHNFMFTMHIDLTDQGLKSVDHVIELCYQAINNIKKQEAPRYIFDEIHRMATIKYQYQSRQDAFKAMMEHAHNLIEEDLATYPEVTSIPQQFSPELVKELASCLTPQNCVVSVLAPLKLIDITADKKEQWLQVPYAVKAIPEEKLTAWLNAAPQASIALPAPNGLIPKQLTVINKGQAAASSAFVYPQPQLINDDEFGKIYFATDTHYLLPEIQWSFEIKTPAIQRGDATKQVLADLYVHTVSEALNTMSYPAMMAGLHYSVTRTDEGIAFSVNGYSENASALFKEILTNLKQAKPDKEKFELYKQSLQRQYENFAKESPLDQAVQMLKGILYKDFVADEAKAQAIQKVAHGDLLKFIANLYRNTYVEGMLYGNMKQEQANELWKEMKSTLASRPFPKDQQTLPKVVLLPAEQGPYYVEGSIKPLGNATILAIQNGPYSFRMRAAQQILDKGIQEPFFSSLRTKQQTGYIVNSWTQVIEQQLFSLFAVQSNSHNGRDLLARFELLIEGFLQELGKTDFPAERFDIIKNAQITSLEQPPKSIYELGTVLQKLAFEQDGDFELVAKRIEGFKELSYDDFVGIAKQFLGRDNKRRIAVIIDGTIEAAKDFTYVKAAQLEQVRGASQYLSKKDVKEMGNAGAGMTTPR